MARTRSRFDRDLEPAPKNDAYTGLLALSLLAMIASSVLLYLDFSQYGAVKAPNVTVPNLKREGLANPAAPVGGQEKVSAPGNASTMLPPHEPAPDATIIPVGATELVPPPPLPGSSADATPIIVPPS